METRWEMPATVNLRQQVFSGCIAFGSLITNENLGFNAVELMPINEFDGNESWGYNPAFFFAPDKFYGTENALKDSLTNAINRVSR